MAKRKEMSCYQIQELQCYKKNHASSLIYQSLNVSIHMFFLIHQGWRSERNAKSVTRFTSHPPFLLFSLGAPQTNTRFVIYV